MTAAILARDGTRLYFRDWGEGRPVVFLAGWGLPSECWAYQAADLSNATRPWPRTPSWWSMRARRMV